MKRLSQKARLVAVSDFENWILQASEVYSAEETEINNLDAAIGNGDHGTKMRRGFHAALEAVGRERPSRISALLKIAARVLIREVPTVSGPLYGTFFLKACLFCSGKEELDSAGLFGLFQNSTEGVIGLGEAERGDKTMVDFWLPVLETMGENQSRVPKKMLGMALRRGQNEMPGIENLIARKGTACYSGDYSVGHQDPGAYTSLLLLGALLEALG